MIDPRVPYAETLAARAHTLSSLCVHEGDALPARGGGSALEPPVVLSSAFDLGTAEEAAALFGGKPSEGSPYAYGRWGNPTVEALEAKVAALEGAEAAVATASGMTAISGALLALCDAGSHVVAPLSMYSESARLLRERLPRFGIAATFVDGEDPESYARAIRPETRVLYLETPSNPILAVTDLARVANIARARGLLTLADNTFATPFGQTPLALGVDLVVHSMTKALGGHGDALGGVVCGSRAVIARVRDLVVKGLGGVLPPLSAYLIARGVRTLAVRQRHACEAAAVLASRLAEHPQVSAVHHPSLESHPGHAQACAQMHTFGSLLSFEVRGSGGETPLARGARLVSAVRLIHHAVSLGDVRSLLVHPASTTHASMPLEVRREARVTDGLLRLSVGIESVEHLWADLEEALARAHGCSRVP